MSEYVYKDDNDDVEGSEKGATKQQPDEEHGGEEEVEEEVSVLSSRSPSTGVRISRKNNKHIRNSNNSNNSNMSLDVDSASHHHVATTMATTRAETRVVKRWKMLLVFVLLVSMIGVGLAVYFFTAKSECVDFHLQFSQDAHKVLEALGGSLDLTLMAVDALAVTMVSHAHYSDQKWPFVTIPDFEVRSSKIRSLSKAVFLNIYPFVTEENRKAWENYTATHNDWVDESMRIQEQDFQTYHGPRSLPRKGEYEVYNVIHGYDEFDKEDPGKEGTTRPGPYMPIWQASPVIPTYPPYNWDLLSSTATSSMDTVLKTKRVVITEAYMIPDYSDAEKLTETQTFADWFRDYVGPNKDPMEPVSDIYYPILESMRERVHVDTHETSTMDNTKKTSTMDNTKNNVVAFLSLSIYWRDALEQILPPGSNGIVIVFENPCNPSFTYQIDGPNATYLGSGDLHDHRFDSLVKSSKLKKSLHGDDDDHELSYTGIHVHEEYCPFTIHIYPSADMENDYTSNQPIIFSVAAILIFAVTCTVFIMYDRWVEKRQVKVLGSALEATFNVGLLEELVRERTKKLESSYLRLEQANAQLEQANAQLAQASAAQLRTFASMSHEIRTPLNCLVGLSSILAEDADLNARQRESINMIIHSGELLCNVVNDVLDYAKLESGSFVIDKQRISLQDTLNTLVHSIGSNEVILATKPSLRLVTCYHAEVPEFLVSDGRRLQQILYNLLGNAIKFSKDDGTVELGVSIIHTTDDNAVTVHDGSISFWDDESLVAEETGTSEKVIQQKRQKLTDATRPEQAAPSQQFSTSTIRRRIRFTVKDYGKGIAAKDFEAIFQPFSQASQETSNTYGGTGLGLSITARIVEALGGTISVDSKVGEWSKFTVDLPMTQEEDFTNTDGMGEPTGPSATANSCNATVVDLEYLSSRLGHAFVCLVGTVPRVDHIANIFHDYKVSFAYFDNVAELVANVSWLDPQWPQQAHATRTLICLVQEDLVGNDIHSLLDEYTSKTVLLTFGPKHSLDDGVNGHYRSLEQMLPSVLIKDLGDYCCRETSNIETTDADVQREHDVEREASNLRWSCNNADTTPTAASSSSAEPTTKVSLPILGTERVPESVATAATTTIPPSSPFGHLRILIAEDNLVNQKVLGRILDGLGVKNVEIVNNGKKAVELEAANPYDIIFMDVQMPVMDGIQACKLLRSRRPGLTSEHALASVVFVTAQVSLSFEAEYFEAGAYDFLPKPCSMNGVRNCLKKYVDMQQSSRSPPPLQHDSEVDEFSEDLVHC